MDEEQKKKYQKKWRQEHKEHIREYTRDYYQAHKEELNKRHKKYHQEHPKLIRAIERKSKRRRLLHTGGHFLYGLNKRPYPGFCETCGKPMERYLNYHHWDDNNPSVGIWVCRHCHWLIEDLEKGFLSLCLQNYVSLKESITRNREYATKKIQ